MSKPITAGRMFASTNHTFHQHFAYILFLAAIFIAVGFLLSSVAVSMNANHSTALVFVVMFLMLLVYAKLAIMIHRLVILNEKGLSLIFKWSPVELKFIAWIGVTAAILGLFFFLIIRINLSPPSASSGAGSFALVLIVSMIVLGIIFSRFALIFPATAAGHKLTPSDSWKLSSQHKFLLFTLVIIVPYVTNRILGNIPEGNILWSLLVEVISVLVIIYEVGLLSHCYEALTDENGDSDHQSES